MCRGDAWTKDESVRLSGRLVRSLRLLTAADEMEGRVVRRSTNYCRGRRGLEGLGINLLQRKRWSNKRKWKGGDGLRSTGLGEMEKGSRGETTAVDREMEGGMKYCGWKGKGVGEVLQWAS